METELTRILHQVCETLKIEHCDFHLPNESIKTEGFLSDFFTGTITDKETGDTISVAIKIAPQKAGLFQKFDLLYRNEDFFYSKLFPALETFQNEKKVQNPFNNIPKYFCSSTEPGKEYIVMQNITDLGYRLTEKSDFLDQNHLNLMFETYGKFHALSFAFKDQHLEKYNEIMKNSVDVFGSIKETDPIVDSIENNVLSAFKAFENPIDIEILNKLEGIRNIKKILVDDSKYSGDHGCIIQGDCWSNNMLFKYQVNIINFCFND